MTLFYAVILLGVLIFVHEFGHFLLAKLLRVKVLKFSLGFGPKVVGRTYGETEYLISAVPLGGYVKMLGQEDMPTEEQEIPEEERARAFNFQPVWKRGAIVLAGPLFNIMFAGVVFFFIFMGGVPAAYPDLGKIEDDSPAARAGLMTGDRVLEVDGKPVVSYDDIQSSIESGGGRPLLFSVRRDGRVIELRVTPEKKAGRNIFGESKDAWDAGISPLLFSVVGDVAKGSPASKAGLRRGDRIVALEGKTIKIWTDLTAVVHASPGKPLRFSVQRGPEVFDLTITPEMKGLKTPDGAEKKIGLIGISPLGNDFIRRFSLPKAVVLGAGKTWEVSVLTFVSIIKLVQRIIPAETIGGPIMIVQMAGQQASQGPTSFFMFMAIISINLGVLNILPIPILDGGHLLFMGIEVVRRKPLSDRAIMMAQRVGLALLVTLMVFALYNDIMRVVTGKLTP